MKTTELQKLINDRTRDGLYGTNPDISKIIIKEIERFLIYFDKMDRQTNINLKSLAISMPSCNYRGLPIKNSYDGKTGPVEDCLDLDFAFAYTLFWVIGSKLSVKVWFTETTQFFVSSDIDETARKVLWTLDLSSLN